MSRNDSLGARAVAMRRGSYQILKTPDGRDTLCTRRDDVIPKPLAARPWGVPMPVELLPAHIRDTIDRTGHYLIEKR